MTNDAPEVIVCAGPPACLLQGDEAVKNAQDGCPLCTHFKAGATEDDDLGYQLGRQS